MRHFLLSTLVLALLVVGILIPLPAGAVNIVAYDVPVQAGNQGFTGSLGLDFNVVSSITVIGLGVFDSNGDGISTLGALAAQIFNRTSTLAVTVPLTFTNALPGTLNNGSRFKLLPTPVTLSAGLYSIVAWGFSAADLNGNSTLGPPFSFSTENTGGGLISFVGTGRYDSTPALYPTTTATGGPSNVFNAGTFVYTAAVPEPTSLLLLGSGLTGLGLLNLWMRSRRKGAQA